MMKPKLIVILGPTAVGKSDIAVWLAKKLGGEVISADSRQIYRDLNIGTGKITKKEMCGVPHHLLSITDPRQQFNVVQYAAHARKVIGEILHRGKVPIICGGSGFYISALLGNERIPDVPPDRKLRKRLGNKTVLELFRMLQKLDPARTKNIDPHNSRRLIRAIEIARSTRFDLVNKVEPCNFKTLKIGVAVPNQKLRDRIHTRLLERFRRGMITEARSLHAKGLSGKRMEELGLEYRYLARFLHGKLTRDEMIQRLETEIWHYAKRQMTWFKRNKDIYWFQPNQQVKIKKLASSFLKRKL